MYIIAPANLHIFQPGIKIIAFTKVILNLTILAALIGRAFLNIDMGVLQLTPTRILLPVLWLSFIIGILINRGKINISGIRVKNYLLFLGSWILYAVFSMAWAADIAAATRDMAFLLINISFILFMVYYLTDLHNLSRIFGIWLLMLVLLLGIGLWEHMTGAHLPVSGLAGMPDDPSRYMPTGIYGNPNNFATYLSLSIPFVISYIRYSKELYERAIGITILFVSLYVLILTESRANYMAIIFGAIVWFIFMLGIKTKFRLMGLSAVLLLLLVMVFPAVVQYLTNGVFSQLTSLLSLSEAGMGSSIGVRLNLIRNALTFLVNSCGFGVGGGNVEYYMANFMQYDTRGITSVHNFWVQIVSDYGLFVFTGFVLFYGFLIGRLSSAYRKLKKTAEKMVCEALLLGLVIFLFASISPSNTMALEAQWVFFGFALAFLNYYRLSRTAAAA